MRKFRLRRSVALVLMVTQLVGCYHWVATPTRVGALAQDSVPKLRLTLRDETRVTVVQPTVVGDSIYGTSVSGDGARGTALEQVGLVEVWEMDKGKTAVSAVGVGLMVGFVVFLIICNPRDGAFGTVSCQ